MIETALILASICIIFYVRKFIYSNENFKKQNTFVSISFIILFSFLFFNSIKRAVLTMNIPILLCMISIISYFLYKAFWKTKDAK